MGHGALTAKSPKTARASHGKAVRRVLPETGVEVSLGKDVSHQKVVGKQITGIRTLLDAQKSICHVENKY